MPMHEKALLDPLGRLRISATDQARVQMFSGRIRTYNQPALRQPLYQLSYLEHNSYSIFKKSTQEVGLEPTTKRLTAARSAAELLLKIEPKLGCTSITYYTYPGDRNRTCKTLSQSQSGKPITHTRERKILCQELAY
jgi:hypothetical protein